VRIRFRPELNRTAAEHFAAGFELDVDFKADGDEVVFMVQAAPGAGSAKRGIFSISHADFHLKGTKKRNLLKYGRFAFRERLR